MYLKEGDEKVSDTNFHWKANNHGRVKIEFKETHKNFVLNGTYFLAVYPYRKGVNTFNIKLTLIEGKPIRLLGN